MARCRYHPMGKGPFSDKEPCGPSANRDVERFRLGIKGAFPTEDGFWTSCLELVWRDLERFVGQGKAIGIMWDCLEETRKRELGTKRNPNPHLRYLHTVLVERVEEVEPAGPVSEYEF